MLLRPGQSEANRSLWHWIDGDPAPWACFKVNGCRFRSSWIVMPGLRFLRVASCSTGTFDFYASPRMRRTVEASGRRLGIHPTKAEQHLVDVEPQLGRVGRLVGDARAQPGLPPQSESRCCGNVVPVQSGRLYSVLRTPERRYESPTRADGGQ
jgi:hypothetical protein